MKGNCDKCGFTGTVVSFNYNENDYPTLTPGTDVTLCAICWEQEMGTIDNWFDNSTPL